MFVHERCLAVCLLKTAGCPILAAALVNFSEDIPQEYLSPYLNSLIPQLIQLIQVTMSCFKSNTCPTPAHMGALQLH